MASGFVIGSERGNDEGEDRVSFLAPTPSTRKGESEGETLLDPSWAIEHASQIEPLLPGGLAIRGLFIAADDQKLTSLLPLIKKVLKSVLASSGWTSEREFLILQIEPSSAAVRYIKIRPDDENRQSLPPKSAELTFKDNLKWLEVKGNFILDLASITLNGDEYKFASQTERLVKSLERLLRESSEIIFDNEIRDANAPLDPESRDVPSKKKGKKKAQEKIEEDDEELEPKVYEAQILLLDDLVEENSEDDALVKAGSRLKLGGRLSLRCFLHPAATIKEAKDAVIQDILRSLKARFKFHVDSLEVDDKHYTSEMESPVVHEPPRRIMISVPHSSSVCVSDYLQSGETCYDSTESVKELFGFEPVVERMNDELELVASDAEIEAVEGEDEEERLRASPELGNLINEPRSFSSCNPFSFALILGSILLAVSAYYAVS